MWTYTKDSMDFVTVSTGLILPYWMGLPIRYIQPLYQHYAGVSKFDDSVNSNDIVLSKLYSVCDNIRKTDTDLENKIVLAIGIRHKAEEYMIQEIRNYKGTLIWRKNKNIQLGTSTDFLTFIESNKNQTRELYNGFKQLGKFEEKKLLNEVNIMTPEQIHLNSFMYEPILDMDIVELLNLYHKIKKLCENQSI